MAAGRLMILRLRELAAQKVSFAFETTLSGRAYRPLLTEMRSTGYRIELDFLWLPQSYQSIDRVAQRVIQGGHDVPEDVIRRRHPKGLQNLFSLYRPLLDRWSIHDNTVYPAHEIVREIDGSLLILDMEEFAKIEKVAHNVLQ